MTPDAITSPLAGLRPLADRLAGQRLLVWGDLVADRFLTGSTTRVSREAPALVLRYEGEEMRPGGAGNAALNAAALGARVTVAGFLGADDVGRALRDRLEEHGLDTSAVLERDDGRTPVKTRVMAGGLHTVRQQILRIDDDRAWSPADGARERLRTRLAAALADADAVLISDYGLGTVVPALFRTLRGELGGRPVALDSRFAILEYPGVTTATPNEAEVEEALGLDLAGDDVVVERAGTLLLDRLESDSVIITRGSRGMAVFRRHESPVHLPIHGTDQIADVTGAGDTVIATLALALAAGGDLLAAARLANVAAGLVVLKHGTATVGAAELAAALDEAP